MPSRFCSIVLLFLSHCLENQPLTEPGLTSIVNLDTSLGSPVVKNLPVNAEDTGSIPGPGRSHMLWSNKVHRPQLLEPARLEPVLSNKRSHGSEKPVYHN